MKILLEGPPNKQLNITLINYIFCTYAGEADSESWTKGTFIWVKPYHEIQVRNQLLLENWCGLRQAL
jgi:hypothetical protein